MVFKQHWQLLVILRSSREEFSVVPKQNQKTLLELKEKKKKKPTQHPKTKPSFVTCPSEERQGAYIKWWFSSPLPLFSPPQASSSITKCHCAWQERTSSMGWVTLTPFWCLNQGSCNTAIIGCLVPVFHKKEMGIWGNCHFGYHYHGGEFSSLQNTPDTSFHSKTYVMQLLTQSLGIRIFSLCLLRSLGITVIQSAFNVLNKIHKMHWIWRIWLSRVAEFSCQCSTAYNLNSFFIRN